MLAAVFTAVAGVSAATAQPAVCNSETVRPMAVNELDRPLAAAQAVNFLVMFDKDHDLWTQLRGGTPDHIGRILANTATGPVRFAPDSVKIVSSRHFDQYPVINIAVCGDGNFNVFDLMEALKQIEGIKTAAPDVELYEIPLIPGP